MSEIRGVVSLLDDQHTTLVESIWRELEMDCGLTGIQVTPIPHFTWQVVEKYNWDVLEEKIQQLSSDLEPFYVHTTGLSFFSGESPVAYIPIIRTKNLSEIHEFIWHTSSPAAVNPAAYYSPELWMPHITLAIFDVDRETIQCIVSKLAFRNLDWKIRINSLLAVAQPEGKCVETRFEYQFEE